MALRPEVDVHRRGLALEPGRRRTTGSLTGDNQHGRNHHRRDVHARMVEMLIDRMIEFTWDYQRELAKDGPKSAPLSPPFDETGSKLTSA